MDVLLAGLRACAEPTRLRLLALAARGTFCVMDFCDILGQSQPRLSRHLRLLCEAGLLDRIREGANVWFALPSAGSAAESLVRAILERVPEEEAVLAADRRQAARVLAERARAASEVFRKKGADWDEMRALGLPAAAVERAILDMLPAGRIGRLLDIGTGTGRLLELLAPRIGSGLGIDASRTMLALARTRLAKPGLGHIAVRLADMYRMPLADAAFDVVVLQMVLHYAEDPAAAIVVDLAAHDSRDVLERLVHRWPGFSDERIDDLLTGAGLASARSSVVPGPFEVRLWTAASPVAAVPADLMMEETR
jgi:SAM-dependent methyltransferase